MTVDLSKMSDDDFALIQEQVKQRREAMDPEKNESTMANLFRQAGRSGLAASTAVLGAGGDLIQGLAGLAEALPQGPEALRREPTLLAKGLQAVAKNVPGQEELKEPSRRIASALGFEGFFDPQTPTEQFADEIVSDFAMLALPVKGKIPFVRALSTSIGSNIIGEAVKQDSGSATAGTLAKATTMFLMGMMRRPSANKYIDNLYAEVQDTARPGLRVNGVQLEKDLKGLRKQIVSGGKTEFDQKLLDLIDPAIAQAEQGTIEAMEALQFRRNAGRVRGLDATAKKQLGSFKKNMDTALFQLDAINPNFSEVMQRSHNTLEAMYKGEAAAESIRVGLGKGKFSTVTKAILAQVSPGLVGATVAGQALASPAARIGTILTNPSFRPHLLNLFKAAAVDNAAGIAKALAGLDKAVLADEKNKKKKSQPL